MNPLQILFSPSFSGLAGDGAPELVEGLFDETLQPLLVPIADPPAVIGPPAPSVSFADMPHTSEEQEEGDPSLPSALLALLNPVFPERPRPAASGHFLPPNQAVSKTISPSSSQSLPTPETTPIIATEETVAADAKVTDPALTITLPAEHLVPKTPSPAAEATRIQNRPLPTLPQAPLPMAQEPLATPDSERSDFSASPNPLTEAIEETLSAGKGATGPSPDTGNASEAQIAVMAAQRPMATGHALPTPAPATPVSIDLPTSPYQPEFPQETAQQVTWLIGQGIQRAEIRLNPRELGPIHIEISTQDDKVDVSFAVQHPHTVHALQQTLPHLQEMLTQQGLNLGDASVDQHTARESPAERTAMGESGQAEGSAADEEAVTPQRIRTAVPGRVDDYA